MAGNEDHKMLLSSRNQNRMLHYTILGYVHDQPGLPVPEARLF